MKRSAGSGKATQFKHVVKWDPNNGDKTRSRNVFACLHYCRSKTYIKKNYPTMSVDDIKVALSYVLREAGAVWDKHNH